MKLRSLVIVLFGLTITLPGLAKNKRGKRPMKLISYNIEYGMRADTTTNKSVFAAWIRSQTRTSYACKRLINSHKNLLKH